MNLSAVPDRMPDLSQVAHVDEVGVKERVARFQTRSIKKESKIFCANGIDARRSIAG